MCQPGVYQSFLYCWWKTSFMCPAWLQLGSLKGNLEVAGPVVCSCNAGIPRHPWDAMLKTPSAHVCCQVFLHSWSWVAVPEGDLAGCQCEALETEVGMSSPGHSLVLLLIHRGKIR